MRDDIKPVGCTILFYIVGLLLISAMADQARARAGRLAGRTRQLRAARGLSPIRKRLSRRDTVPVAERRAELDGLFGLPLSFRTHAAALGTRERTNDRPTPFWRFIFFSRERPGEWADNAELERVARVGGQLDGGWARSRRAAREGRGLPRSGDTFEVSQGRLALTLRVLHGPHDGEGVVRAGPVRSERRERGTFVTHVFLTQ